MRRLAAALTLMFATPTAAQEPGPDPYRALQQLDQRLFETGWRLATANAPFCARTTRSLGVQWQDLASYPDPDEAGRALGTIGPVWAQAVALDSPAAKAGLEAGDTLHAVNGLAVAEQFPPSDPAWQRRTDLLDRIDLLVAFNGFIYLAWLGDDGRPEPYRTIEGQLACQSRFEIAGSIGDRATADGQRVVFGPEFPGFAYPDDLFAAAVAHELAHNLLDHRLWLDANGRKRKNIRLTESEADRLAPWLLLNAGYEPEAMVRLLEQLRPGAGGNFLSGRTHRGWDERAETIAAEIERVREFIDSEGRADWSQHFARETDK